MIKKMKQTIYIKLFSIICALTGLCSCNSGNSNNPGLFGLGIELGDSYDKVFDKLTKDSPYNFYSDDTRDYEKEYLSHMGVWGLHHFCFYTKPFDINGIEFDCIYPKFNTNLELIGIEVLGSREFITDGSNYYKISEDDYKRISEYLNKIYPQSSRIREYPREEKKLYYSHSQFNESFITETDSIALSQSIDYEGSDQSYALITLGIFLRGAAEKAFDEFPDEATRNKYDNMDNIEEFEYEELEEVYIP